MNRRILLTVGLVVATAAQFPGSALAQIEDNSRETRAYQFVPSSTLTETGGFAGVHVNYSVRGTYDFTVEPGEMDDVALRHTSHFTDVQAGLFHPILTNVRPLDEVLNLTSLTGHEVLTPGPLQVFRYQGTTDDGSSIQGVTATLGRWMFLRFGTKAPAGSADFFEYQLLGLARERRLADFTANDAVDGTDLAALIPKFAANLPPAVDSPAWGDANGDRRVDGADLLLWQQQLGEAPPDFTRFESMVDVALAAAGSPSLAAVPEPSALACAAAAVAFLAARRRGHAALL